MQYIDVENDAEAFKRVLNGQAYAAFSVAGWPHGPISKLAQSSGLTLAGFDVKVDDTYQVRPFTYKNIGVYNVQALSVRNVLVTRPFSVASRVAEVAALKRMIARELPELKDGAYEPGWNEITTLDITDLGKDVKRFQGAQAPTPASELAVAKAKKK